VPLTRGEKVALAAGGLACAVAVGCLIYTATSARAAPTPPTPPAPPAPGKVRLEVRAVGGGTTDPAPGVYYVDAGSRVTLTAVPTLGRFLSWVVDSEQYGEPRITVTAYKDTVATAWFTTPEGKLPLPEKGYVHVRAYADSDEVTAEVREVVDLATGRPILKRGDVVLYTPCTLELDPGSYRVTVGLGSVEQSKDCSVSAGQTVALDFRFPKPTGTGKVYLQAWKASLNAEVTARVDIEGLGTYYTPCWVEGPEGIYNATATYGGEVIRDRIEIIGGQQYVKGYTFDP